MHGSTSLSLCHLQFCSVILNSLSALNYQGSIRAWSRNSVCLHKCIYTQLHTHPTLSRTQYTETHMSIRTLQTPTPHHIYTSTHIPYTHTLHSLPSTNHTRTMHEHAYFNAQMYHTNTMTHALHIYRQSQIYTYHIHHNHIPSTLPWHSINTYMWTHTLQIHTCTPHIHICTYKHNIQTTNTYTYTTALWCENEQKY